MRNKLQIARKRIPPCEPPFWAQGGHLQTILGHLLPSQNIQGNQKEFLIPLEITAYRLSKDIGIPQTRVSEIIKGRRRITADTALRLSIYFGNSARFWLGLQDDFDIEEETNQKKTAFKAIRHFTNKAA